jgi:hypothetical protein
MGAQGIGDQLSHASQEFRAHAGMEAIAIRAADGEEADRAFLS